MSRTTRVHIIHTNDIHSHFEAMPRIHRVISDLSRNCRDRGEACWVMDIGDHMDRFAVETEGTGGLANRHVMEATGYDFMTLGNNELLTFSKAELDQLFRDAPFEVLAANVRDAAGETPEWLRTCSFRETNGFRVAFTGVTIAFTEFYRLLGWEVVDPFPILAETVPRLRQQADAVVVLSHLGLRNDRHLAQAVPGVDVILGAHTHHLLEELEQVGDTWIAAAGKFGQYVGHLTLEWETRSRHLTVTGQVLPVGNTTTDPMMVGRIKEERRRAEIALSRPILHLEQDLRMDWYGESPLGNLLADGLMEWVGADCALVNAGQLLGNLETGPVTPGRIHEICPHPINPCAMTLSGAAIQQSLEESLLQDIQRTEIRGFGFRGRRLGILNMAGMEAVYDPVAAPFQRIREIRIAGEILQSHRLYRVGTIDMFTFGIGYPAIQGGTDLRFYLPEMLRDVIAHTLTIPGALERARKPRWHPTTPSS